MRVTDSSGPRQTCFGPAVANSRAAEENIMFELFRTRRFLPLFITQFFGAFNDNYLKCAILTLVTFKLAADASRAAMLTNLAMAVFILPYFLFSALAGQISDKFDKAPCCRIVKFAEIVLMALAAAAFLCGNIPALLMLLFLMGAQSTFFSPAKYSLLPQHLKERELVAGNALIEGGTFLAILIGSIAGSLIIALPGGEGWSGLLLTGLAIIGYMASCRIPPAPPIEPGVRLSLHLAGETKKILQDAFRRIRVRRCILALSGFWMVGSLYVSQLPGLSRDVLGANHYVNTFFLTLFSIGVALGSVAASKLLHGKISARLAPAAALGMALFTLDLFFATCGKGGAEGELRSFFELAATFSFWRMVLDLLGIAVTGGLFSVPLQALMQRAAPAGMTARIIAANNIVNAFFMALAALAAALAVKCFALSVSGIFLAVAVINAMNAVYSLKLLRSPARRHQ